MNSNGSALPLRGGKGPDALVAGVGGMG